MPFESFRSFFGKKEGQTGEELPDTNGLGSAHQPLPDNTNRARSLEDINEHIRQSLEENRREEEQIELDAHKRRVARAPEILKQNSLQRLPSITKILDRALSNASVEDYAQEHIRIPPGDLPFWHYDDLESSLSEIECWREYLPQEALDAISRKITARVDVVLRIMDEYRAWGIEHEPSNEVQRNVFRDFSILYELAPESFPRAISRSPIRSSRKSVHSKSARLWTQRNEWRFMQSSPNMILKGSGRSSVQDTLRKSYPRKGNVVKGGNGRTPSECRREVRI